MARPKGSFKSAPAYRLHKATGQAVVTLCGKDHYLGKHESGASWERYYRLLSEWKSLGGQIAPATPPQEVTVAEVMASFWAYAQQEYAGRRNTLDRFRMALRPLRELYASTAAAEFGSKEFRAVREAVLGRRNRWGERLTYRTVNGYMWCVGELFRWAAEQEVIPASVSHALQVVKPLMRGKSGARDPSDVEPVPQEHLDATLPLLPPMVRDICDLMLLCGARPGEIVRLRASDLDTRGPVWAAKLEKHKTAHKGHKRALYFGPRAQTILARYLTPDIGAYLFKPFETGRPAGERERPADGTPRRRRDPLLPPGVLPLTEADAPPLQPCAPRAPTAPTAAQSEADDARRERRNLLRRRRRKYKPQRNTWYARRTTGDLRANPHFNRAALERWVRRACDRADARARRKNPDAPADARLVPRWHPHRLRHNAGTNIRNEFGLDVARAVLGHRHKHTTEIYAADGEVAARVMAQVG
jgi:integrase